MDLFNIKWDNTMSVLDSYRMEVENGYRQSLQDNDHVATHGLIDSIRTEVHMDSASFEVILSVTDYWKYVEDDTKPHFPPRQPILNWIRAKNIVPRPSQDGRLPSENQLAYLIQRKIGFEGTTGTHDLENTLEDVNRRYVKMICDAVLLDVKKYFIERLIND